MWKQKTEDEIISELPKSLEIMSRNFSIIDFYTNSPETTEDYISTIVITPMQVVSAYMPEIGEKRIKHKDLKHAIFTQLGVDENYPKIVIEGDSNEFALFSICRIEPEESAYITEDMYKVFKGLKGIIDSISEENISFESNFEDYKIPLIVTKDVIGDIDSERLVGVRIKDYIDYLETEEKIRFNNEQRCKDSKEEDLEL